MTLLYPINVVTILWLHGERLLRLARYGNIAHTRVIFWVIVAPIKDTTRSTTNIATENNMLILWIPTRQILWGQRLQITQP